jgi:hypothetical protein
MLPLEGGAATGGDAWPKIVRNVSGQDLSPAIDRSDTFTIRLADTEGQRSNASFLVKRMYTWRGFDTSTSMPKPSSLVTLCASHKQQTIGTLTIAFDSPAGMLAEAQYAGELANLRQRGANLCEFTKFAVARSVKSLRVLAALFCVAFIYARLLRGCTDLIIEVIPKHAEFYEKMLGFKKLGAETINPRVRYPVVLLWLDLEYAEHQIATLGGKGTQSGVKSLYPYGFDLPQAKGIARRLAELH